MDLFAEQRNAHRKAAEPLALRMRPQSLEEVAGQQSFLGPGELLRRLLDADRLTGAVFYGPPGSGKTTLAQLIASKTNATFVSLHAAQAGVKDVREILTKARDRLEAGGGRTMLFVDELHRFSRSQQDVLLDDVERGVVIFIGATTENPFFSVNTPLLSRVHIFQFEPLTVDDIIALLRRAIADPDRGLGKMSIQLAEDAERFLAETCDGDARRALNALEVCVLSQPAKRGNKTLTITLQDAAESIQRKAISYDRDGDNHYDAASAFIKSIRGSDPDATIYWMSRMLEAGEDPRFIARRLVISASEDIGNADSRGLVIAQAAAAATEFVGLPECKLILAHAAMYLACAPKSNACAVALWTASDDVKHQRILPVPKELRATGYAGAKKFGHGDGYQYPHDHPNAVIAGDYYGVEKRYYEPTDRGEEATIRKRLEAIRRLAADEPQSEQPQDGQKRPT